jgi:cyclic pyranopterin phosphate synthase
VTGGEPLVRKDAEHFIADLIAMPGVDQVGLSTNGTRLAPIAAHLAKAGLRSVNISLDALDPAIYSRITGGKFQDAMAGIDAALEAGIPVIKLNAVLMRGVNEHEIWPLAEFAARKRLILRFIELMPVSLTEMLNESNFLPAGEAKQMIASHTPMIADESRYGNGPAQYFRLPELDSSVGFIGAMTNLHFCEACNKIRLTADGKIRPCLGNHGELDLKPALRPEIDRAMLREIFLTSLREKPPEHQFRNQYQPGRIMTAIGG